jgi:uncharacterized protein with GYD domain
METHVVLFNWTDQGIKGFKDSPAPEPVKSNETLGGRV